MSKGRRNAAPRFPFPAQSSAPPDPVRRAYSLYTEGKWAEAEALCRSILARQPDHPGALTLLGVIMAQSGRSAQAAEFLGRAAAATPENPEAHNNHGNALRDLGRYFHAISCYARALALNPDYAEAHYNRGVTQYDLRQYRAAIESFERALSLKPDYAAAWNNRGAALRELGELEAALSSCDRAIAVKPDHAEAHNNRGAVLHRLERHEEALASCDRALELKPDHAAAHNNRGGALHALQRPEQALSCYDRALAIVPEWAEAHCNRGVALNDLERYEEALESFARAISIAPGHLSAYHNRAVTLRLLRRFDEALASLDKALAMNPRFADAHFSRGVIMHDLMRHYDALESYDRALFLGRRDADTYRNRGIVMDALGYSEEAVTSYERAVALDPHGKFLRGIIRHARMRICDWSGYESDRDEIVAGIELGEAVTSPFALLSLVDSPSLQRKSAEIWVREQCTPRAQPGPLPRYPRREKIRIGYFSADFRNHAVAALAAELFELHDHSRFDLTAFSLGPDTRDELRARVEPAFDRFLPVGGMSDHDIAALARQLQIDIAVDLGGYTQDARPRILALRAAPIQASYLGYLGTMGGQFMDYLIADPVLVPPESRMHYAERIAYLPSYQVNDSKRPRPDSTVARAELGLPPSGFVYCCFNASYKITPECFSSWMRILAATPGSVLFLLARSETVRSNLRREAQTRGINPERLIFDGPLPFGRYLARYQAADLFLDTTPYNAGTTASDALWAGLPVLTCPGESFSARMAASLLAAAGLPELIAANRTDYERLAIELAADRQRLAALKSSMACKLELNPLFDTSALTRNLEGLYVRMYERYHAGLETEHLQLP
ncbi:MAG: tetratricopeptide repeat protein [Steroidobacteraceae bacterium]